MRTLSLLAVLPALALAAPDFAKLDALYEKRDEPAASQELTAGMADALKSAPDDYGVLWRAARLKQWVADGLPSGDAKRDMSKACWALADRAVARNASGVEGQFYAAACIGNYSQAVGILHALGEGLEGKFNDRLDTSIKLDSSFDHGAPMVAKGRYYFELPWPKRDLGKSAEWYQKAIARNPENLRTYLYLAATWADDGKAKQAKEMLTKAMTGPIDFDPPEGRRVQREAKQLQADKRELR